MNRSLGFSACLTSLLALAIGLAAVPLRAQAPIPYSHAPEDRAEAPFRFHGPSNMPASMAIRGDSVVIAGYFHGADGLAAKSILVWDGKRWTEGYPGIGNGLRGIRYHGNRLYASGFITLDAAWPQQRVAVWDMAKGGWQYLGGPFEIQAFPGPMAVLGDTLVVATRIGVYCWTGNEWTLLGKPYKGEPSRLENFAGKLWLAGEFEQDTAVGNLMVWDAGAWKTPAGTSLHPVTEIAWHEGSLFMIEQAARGRNDFRLTRKVDTGWVDIIESTHPFYLGKMASNGRELYLTGKSLDGFALLRWDGEGFELFDYRKGKGGGPEGFLAFTRGGRLIKAANFTSIGEKRMDYMAAWDGQEWSALSEGGPLGIDGPPTALYSDGDRLFIGSNILTLAGDENRVMNGVTAWDGATWDSLDGGLRDPEDFRLAEFHAFCKGRDGVYAGGSFLETRTGSAANVARWDGTRWHPLGDGFSGQVRAFLARGDGMIVAGRDDAPVSAGTNALPGGHAAGIWNGTSWSALGGGISGEVLALAEYQGDLYAAGRFRILPAGPVCGIARFSGNTWTALPKPAVDSALTDSVYALSVFRGRLYALGRQLPSQFPWKEALLAWDGQAWAHVEGVMQGYSLLSDSSALYVSFTNFLDNRPTEASGAVRAARYDGNSWLLMPASGASSDVRTMALHKGYLYLGGWMSAFNGKPAAWLARWNLQGAASIVPPRGSVPPARAARRFLRFKEGGAMPDLQGWEVYGLDGRSQGAQRRAASAAAGPLLLKPAAGGRKRK